ncbi:CPBP family intramembrane glutamic endopeptidase [Blastococcus mobilis]|uniref:Membrane protease YdiL, CAAX protease family n=1 Tax=Blastococcus mobilis TaxID=1938746 RepID=A0A238UQZ3_9ACTN|nr:CPBP family intramembrane glutamic endopeptidase [Blastococcus mobilis]SNR23739.1 Membrane protease YdiL, CAAX protease family [Blastococcus mobilis]
MHARPAGRRRALAFAAPLVLVLTAWNNLIVPRLPTAPASYVVVNAGATVVLLAAARSARLPWHELGLARRRLAAGARWGGAGAAVVATGYAVALLLPGVRPLLKDARIAGLDGGQLAFQVLVRIPVGTVLWEEVAFRGVLPAALGGAVSPRAATAGAGIVFGIWHIRPTLSALAANDLADGPVSRGVAVLLGCLVTAGAGVLLTWLRLRSGSLLAPVLLHLAANCLGTLAAAAAHRLD